MSVMSILMVLMAIFFIAVMAWAGCGLRQPQNRRTSPAGAPLNGGKAC